MLFTSIAFAEPAGGFATHSERTSLRRPGLFTNRALVGAVALTVALLGLLVVTPFLRDLLELEPLQPSQWVLVVTIALAYLVAVELDKGIAARRGAKALLTVIASLQPPGERLGTGHRRPG